MNKKESNRPINPVAPYDVPLPPIYGASHFKKERQNGVDDTNDAVSVADIVSKPNNSHLSRLDCLSAEAAEDKNDKKEKQS